MSSVTPYLLVLLLLTAAGAASGSVRMLYNYATTATGNAAWGISSGLVAIVFSIALLAFRISRRRLELSRSIVGGSALQLTTQEMVRSIAQRLSISVPQIVLVSSRNAREARVDFLRRSPVVVIPRAIAALGIHRPRHLEGLLAHELSHVANGDARRAAIARIATGLAASIIACTAVFWAAIFVFSYGQAIANFGWRYSFEVAIAVFVSNTLQYAGYAAFLICGYALLLQVREFYADAGAKRLGYANELEEMLKAASVPWSRAWQQITAFHPPAAHRIDSLRDTGGVHELRFLPVAVASALAHASVNLLTDAIQSFDDRDQLVLFAPITFFLILPFVVIAYQYGARFSATPNARRRDLAKGMIIGASAVIVGVMASGLLVQLTNRIEAEAPYGQIALDQLWLQLALGFFTASVLIGATLAGSATSTSPPPSKVERGLWFLFAFILAFVLAQTSLLASFLLILGDDLKGALARMQEVLQINMSSTESARAFKAALGAWIGIFTGAAAFGVAATLLASTKRVRLLMPGSIRALAAISLLATGAVFGGLAGYAGGAEHYMRNTIWISCRTIAGAESEKDRLTRARNLLLQALVATGEQARSFKGPMFAGHMEEGECGDVPMEDRRPWYRHWLVRFEIAKDGIILLSDEPRSSKEVLPIRVTYIDDDARSDLGSIETSGDAAIAAARAFQRFDLYRYALLLRAKRLDDSAAMKEAVDSSDTQTRAWALTQLARTDLASGDREEAERKLLLARRLSPENAIAGGLLVDLYLDTDRCPQATNLFESIRRTDEFTALRLQRAARCRGQEALAFLYKHRGAFADDAAVLAFIGENAYHQRRYSLADRYFLKALAAEKERAIIQKTEPARIGCANLYVAIRGKSNVCVGSELCVPPIDLQTGREHMCWAQHAAAYGKAAEARVHYETAVKMDPGLSAAIQTAVTNLP